VSSVDERDAGRVPPCGSGLCQDQPPFPVDRAWRLGRPPAGRAQAPVRASRRRPSRSALRGDRLRRSRLRHGPHLSGIDGSATHVSRVPSHRSRPRMLPAELRRALKRLQRSTTVALSHLLAHREGGLPHGQSRRLTSASPARLRRRTATIRGSDGQCRSPGRQVDEKGAILLVAVCPAARVFAAALDDVAVLARRPCPELQAGLPVRTAGAIPGLAACVSRHESHSATMLRTSSSKAASFACESGGCDARMPVRSLQSG